MHTVYKGHGITVTHGTGCQGRGYEVDHDLDDDQLREARRAALAEITANLDRAAPGASRTVGLTEASALVLALETRAEWNARQEQEEAEGRADADKEKAECLAEILEWAARPVADRITRAHTGGPWQILVFAGSSVRQFAPECLEAYREAEREAERRNAERARREEEAEREEQERKAAKAKERAEWIEAHGSERLKRHLTEEIEHDAVYRDERLALERPDWQWSSEVAGQYDEPRNVSEEAFRFLDLARRVEPDASIVWWTVPHECDGECYDRGEQCPRYDSSGYAVVAEFIGREIMLVPRDASEAEVSGSGE